MVGPLALLRPCALRLSGTPIRSCRRTGAGAARRCGYCRETRCSASCIQAIFRFIRNYTVGGANRRGCSEARLWAAGNVAGRVDCMNRRRRPATRRQQPGANEMAVRPHPGGDGAGLFDKAQQALQRVRDGLFAHGLAAIGDGYYIYWLSYVLPARARTDRRARAARPAALYRIIPRRPRPDAAAPPSRLRLAAGGGLPGGAACPYSLRGRDIARCPQSAPLHPRLLAPPTV